MPWAGFFGFDPWLVSIFRSLVGNVCLLRFDLEDISRQVHHVQLSG